MIVIERVRESSEKRAILWRQNELSAVAEIIEEMGNPGNKVTVVYIVGAGRSGSTVLDTILGNHPEVESVGELCNLVRSAWFGPEYCACGQRGSICPFWSQVRTDWERRSGTDDLEIYMKLEDVFERSRFFFRLFRERFGQTTEFRNLFELHSFFISGYS